MTKIEERLADKAREMYVPGEMGARRIARHLGVTRHFVERAVGMRNMERERRKKKKRHSYYTFKEREIECQKRDTLSEVVRYAEMENPAMVATVREWITRVLDNSDAWWQARAKWSIARWYREIVK